MRHIERTDAQGRKFLVALPDNAPDSHAQYGVVIGPPDLSELKLPMQMEVRLNNALFARKLFTRIDVRRRKQELLAVWQSVLQADVQTLASVYEPQAAAPVKANNGSKRVTKT